MAPVSMPLPPLDMPRPPKPDTGIAGLIASYQGMGSDAGLYILRQCLTAYAGQVAVVSSFGAQSAILLAFVAEIAPATPVLFIETGKLFPETTQYRLDLTAHLGLLDVRDLRPSTTAMQSHDRYGVLHQSDADLCCALRKVAPLEQGLAPFAAWMNGRRRTQSATRIAMPFFEIVAGRVKINPLAQWTDAQIEAEMIRRRLPRHPLVARGYPSIGCKPCTRPVAAGDDPRSGRWAGTAKTECGIHQSTVESGPAPEYISPGSEPLRG